jgi:hypothetical protein
MMKGSSLGCPSLSDGMIETILVQLAGGRSREPTGRACTGRDTR